MRENKIYNTIAIDIHIAGPHTYVHTENGVCSTGIVVRKERPELEESKDKLVVNIASSKKKLADLEDEILRYTL